MRASHWSKKLFVSETYKTFMGNRVEVPLLPLLKE